MKEAVLREYGLGEYANVTSKESRPTNVTSTCKSSDDEGEKRKTFPSQDSEGCVSVLSQQSEGLKAKAGVARLLLGDCKDASKLKTKVRRSYDIDNILSSLQLIEEAHMAENRKSTFKWLGTKDDLVGPATRMRISGGWKEWSNGVQNQIVPITPPPTYHVPCYDYFGPPNAAAACPTDMNTPTRSECAPVTSQSPGTSSSAMLSMSTGSCPTCQPRGLFDSFYSVRLAGAIFNPFFPAFAMHSQLLNLSSSQANDCLVHRLENGVAAAATMQYGHETLGHMFAYHMETVKPWYAQAASMASLDTPTLRPHTPHSPS